MLCAFTEMLTSVSALVVAKTLLTFSALKSSIIIFDSFVNVKILWVIYATGTQNLYSCGILNSPVGFKKKKHNIIWDSANKRNIIFMKIVGCKINFFRQTGKIFLS